MYDVLSIQRESGNGTKNTRKKRHLQINEGEKNKTKTGVAIGAPAYQRTIERRAAASTKRKHKDENEAIQNKRNTRKRTYYSKQETKKYIGTTV